MAFTIELGSKVESNVSGYKGIVISRSEHLNGCNRYWVVPKAKNGVLNEGFWMDEAELLVKKQPVLLRQNPDRGGAPSKVR